MTADLVVKVGGSLFDLPDLGSRLRAWLDAQRPRRCLLVPGGGPVVEWLRRVDAFEGLGEETSHWLALRALTLSAHVLAVRLPGSFVIKDISDQKCAWNEDKVPILDVHAFARADEARPDHLAHSWNVTSDSLAARVAVVAGATELILLKSKILPPELNWDQASQRAFVDPVFPELAKMLRVTAVNLRSWIAGSAAIPPKNAP